MQENLPPDSFPYESYQSEICFNKSDKLIFRMSNSKFCYTVFKLIVIKPLKCLRRS